MARSPSAALARLTAASLCAALAVLAAACGSSQSATGTSKLAPPTRISDAWPLTDRVVSQAAFPGFLLRQHPPVVSSAPAWAAVERSPVPSAETARLKALGFVSGIDEQLHGRFPLAAEVISVAEQYRTIAAARAELVHQDRQLVDLRGATMSTFPVGIPGARGVRVAGNGSIGLNVLFSVGPYFYLVAAGYPSGARRGPTTTELDAAARSLYLALTGCASQRSGSRAA